MWSATPDSKWYKERGAWLDKESPQSEKDREGWQPSLYRH